MVKGKVVQLFCRYITLQIDAGELIFKPWTVSRSDTFHIIAVGNWVEWGTMFCVGVYIHLGMQFSNH